MTFMYYDPDNDHIEYCQECGEEAQEELLADAEWEGIDADPEKLPLIGHTMLEDEEPFACASCGKEVVA